MKTFAVIIMMLLSIFYLLNPTMGIFEFIPDNIPLVGNLDEAGATALLIMCLRYFGCDITKLFNREKKGVTEV
jgi:uncharacterized membrane protein YkvA (DUF1232 family)